MDKKDAVMLRSDRETRRELRALAGLSDMPMSEYLKQLIHRKWLMAQATGLIGEHYDECLGEIKEEVEE